MLEVFPDAALDQLVFDVTDDRESLVRVVAAGLEAVVSDLILEEVGSVVMSEADEEMFTALAGRVVDGLVVG